LLTPNLQNVTTQGNSTTTDINMNGGDLILSTGKITAGSGITNQTGDIVSEVGRVSVGTTGNPTGATGNIINYGTGSIICEQGHIRAYTYIKADTGDITATTGDIKTLAGNIDSAGTLTAGSGLSDFKGGFACSVAGAANNDIQNESEFEGHTLLNRIQRKAYYQNTSYALPYQLPTLPAFQMFNIPAGYYGLCLFLKGVVGSSVFKFEVSSGGGLTDLIRDYTVKINFQSAFDNSAPVIAPIETFIGQSWSNPSDTTKFSVLINTNANYSAGQIIKISINLEYSPSP